MKIQVLGTGCPKCRQLEANAHLAVDDIGMAATVEKVTDLNEIVDMGVMITPALAVDGVVKSTGKVLSREQIVKILQEGNQNG